MYILYAYIYICIYLHICIYVYRYTIISCMHIHTTCGRLSHLEVSSCATDRGTRDPGAPACVSTAQPGHVQVSANARAIPLGFLTQLCPEYRYIHIYIYIIIWYPPDGSTILRKSLEYEVFSAIFLFWGYGKAAKR